MRIITLIIIFTFCSIKSNSQSLESDSSEEIYFGLRGGLNISKLGGDAIGVEQRTSFHAGLFVGSVVNDNLMYQTELVYSSQGGQNENEELEIKYDYLSLAFLPKFYPFKQGFSLVAGPQFGLLMNGIIIDNAGQEDVKSQLNIVDLSFVFGLNYEFVSIIELQVRYNLGINSTANSPLIPGEKIPNRVIQVGLGIKF